MLRTYRRLILVVLGLSTGFAADSAPLIGPTRKLTVPEATAATRALLEGSKISDILGVTHVSGKYALTDKPFMIEGAEAVQYLGGKVLKLWLYLSTPISTDGIATGRSTCPTSSHWH